MKVPSSKPPRLWSLSTSNLVKMTLGVANLSHERPGSPSWRQNASKKIDVACQFPAPVFHYLVVGLKMRRLKHLPEAPCPRQAWICKPAPEPPSAGRPPFFGGLLCRVGGGAKFIVLEERQ